MIVNFSMSHFLFALNENYILYEKSTIMGYCIINRWPFIDLSTNVTKVYTQCVYPMTFYLISYA